jgi:hypothetical protein
MAIFNPPAQKNSGLRNFISTIKTEGLMRSSRYAVMMTPPKSVGSVANMRKLLLFCSEISLPGQNLITNQIRQYGEIREVPSEKTFDNISMTFYVDNNMEVKLFFDRWLDSIQNPYTRTFEYYENYITDLDIEVEDLKDRKRYSVKLSECYPKSISPISLGYETKEVMKLQVSMNYKYWRSTAYSTPKEAKESQFSRFFQMPTINGNPIPGMSQAQSVPTEYTNDFNGFQQQVNTGETQNITTGVTSIFSGR